MSTTTNDDLAQAARYRSAESRVALTRLRNSLERMEARHAAVSDSQRRALLTRAAVCIMDAWLTQTAASKIVAKTGSAVMLLRLTRSETNTIIDACKRHIDSITDAYKGMTPLQTALAITDDLEIVASKAAPAPAKVNAAKAKQEFERLRGAVKLASDEEEAAANEVNYCPQCGAKLPNGDGSAGTGGDADDQQADEDQAIGGPSKSHRHKHWTVTNLSAIKRAGDGAKPTVRLIASSDSIDLEGDAFTVSALKDMRRDMIGHAAFISHKYDPLDVFGMIQVLRRSVMKERARAGTSRRSLVRAWASAHFRNGCATTDMRARSRATSPPRVRTARHRKATGWSTPRCSASAS